MPATLQNLSHEAARKILREAYQKLFHKEPTDGELDFGLATAFFETGYGRAGGANWAKPGQFAVWASQGLYNWGALESGIPGPERTLNKFLAAGLHPVKKPGTDAGNATYFYLFPSDVEAAQAFLMSWGKPDTLKAAAAGSPQAVAASMKNHGYYSGLWVPPGNPQNMKMPPFKEAGSAAEAERNNIRDYASALKRHVVVVNKAAPLSSQEIATISTKPTSSNWLSDLLSKIEKFLERFAKEETNQFLISLGSSTDQIDTLEYARILTTALQEYLGAKTNICRDPYNVEIECQIVGDKKQLFNAIQELSTNLSKAFQEATPKSIETFALILADTKSDFSSFPIKEAEMNYRKFHLRVFK